MKSITRIGLIAAILLLVNLLSKQYFIRFDLTQNKQYTLSDATKNTLKNLENPIFIRAFFTGNLPQQYQKPQQDFRNILIEYANISKGMVDYEFIDPNLTEEDEQLAMQNGISPVLINVREKDAVAQKKAYMGAVIEAGDNKDVIPFVQPEGPLEYQLTTSIKKVSVTDKPSIAILQGHGQPSLQDMTQSMQTMSVLYNVEPFDPNGADEIPNRFKTVVLIKPQDSLNTRVLTLLDNYLDNGGNLVIAADFVQGNFQNAQGMEFRNGMESWLLKKGIEVKPQFVIDKSSGQVSVQQQQGFFRFNTAVQFPYFPLVNKFKDHPVTKGIEQVVFQMASPMQFVGDSTASFTPLINTSGRSGILNPPLVFDIQKQWTNQDFPMQNITIAGLLEQTNGSKIILFADGDFAVGAQTRGQNPDNISLLVNAVDFLSDDTGLIDLRTKAVVSRPIEEMEESRQSLIKWTSFFLPIILAIGYGILRFQRNRRIRRIRMNEHYI